ncbi:MAG: group II intron reverse transcriptase/maturase [Moorea sp. SIO2B7]|nr:group II intron reverse transcriptase/maturase [Moorena sp. SIO2B7]
MDKELNPMYRCNNSMETWSTINWSKVERELFKLQKRIYKASKSGNEKLVRSLQKLLLKSKNARLKAVRRVTQENQGKNTAGVDGVKSLTPKKRFELVKKLQITGKCAPNRRVWIPKPGKQEKRPLGIPTLSDRARQALTKLALEPEWEAKFDSSSYGFRPGRSTHDAIQAIYLSINKKAKYVLDADITKCFDQINHEKLLDKINTFPKLRRQIKSWLKSGVMDNRTLYPTDEGTPQGGIISPLLANIALHGMEERVKQYAETLKGAQRTNRNSLSIIRYADDFVVIHENLDVIKKCRTILEEWLSEMGLMIHPTKTKITHTLNEYQGHKGFNFLGFNIQQYKVGRTHSGKNRNGEFLGHKTIITPAKESIEKHLKDTRRIIQTHQSSSQAVLISQLNMTIRGWSNYYRAVCSKKTYRTLDNIMWQQLWAWAKRRHPNKNRHWIANKYWKSKGTRNWVFQTEIKGEEITLVRHSDTAITRYVKVKQDRSPDDGGLIYWSARMGKNPNCTHQRAKLLKRQSGKCTECGLTFRDNDIMEIDHIIPISRGGKRRTDNLQLLHRHCHEQKTTADGTDDKSHVREERSEAKVSRSVLKTSY